MIDKREGETKKPMPSEPPIFDRSHQVILPKHSNLPDSQKKAPKPPYDE